MSSYPYEKKKRLAKKISTLKRKEDMVKILEIIYADNKNITENQNGLFMFFDKLNDSTYHKIDLYLRSLVKKKTIDGEGASTIDITTDESSEKNKFVTYAKNEFSDTILKSTSETPKVKYSNREKNIIKRQRYSEQLHSENNPNSNIKYTKFDLSVLSDSESKKEDQVIALSPEVVTTPEPEPEPVVQQVSIEELSIQTTLSEPVPIKRGRGRPKKNPETNIVATTTK